MRRRDINPGDKFGQLTVVEEAPQRRSGRYFKCICDCGSTKEVLLHHLTRLMTKSCGCLRQRNRTKHSMWESREYSTWENMIQRCTNPRSSKYHLYGGRGITVCDRWLKSFEAFYEDMGPRPLKTSLDRIDSDQGYSKSNCRWATTREQFANLSNFRAKVKYDGEVRETEEWIRELGIDRETFRSRVLKGLGLKEALLVAVDIVVLEVSTRQQTIYRLPSFIEKLCFEKEKIVSLLDADHEEPYNGFIVRYLTCFKGWPKKYCSKNSQ